VSVPYVSKGFVYCIILEESMVRHSFSLASRESGAQVWGLSLKGSWHVVLARTNAIVAKLVVAIKLGLKSLPLCSDFFSSCQLP
jgi:hypothetical protein